MARRHQRTGPARREARLAALYDALGSWGDAEEYHLAQVMGARSVLDVGCGTGELLHAARAAGHPGELVGVDPAPAMIAAARLRCPEVTWETGYARRLELGRAFELITTSGRVLQELLDDADLTAALRAFRRHLVPGGRLVFATRNPALRHWEEWTPVRTRTAVRSPHGEDFDVSYEFDGVLAPDLVRYTTRFSSRDSGEVIAAAGTLRFIDPALLRAHLADAGFTVESWHGDFDGSPFAPHSPEVIVRAVRPPADGS